jgi:hypothetical protein
LLLVHLKNGDLDELQNAVRFERFDDEYICFDELGNRVAVYRISEVEAFTPEPSLSEQIRETEWKP